MFPNVRLIVVAILAAIAGIGCGLGLFATFRVNHEPLARLAEGSPPLQLAFDNLALGPDPRVSLEARLPLSGAAKIVSVPAIIAAPGLAPNPAPEQAEADSAIAGDSSAQQAAAGIGAAEQSSTTSLAVAAPAEQSSVTPEASAPSQQEAAAAASDQQPAAPAATAPPAEQTAVVDAAAPDQRPPVKPTRSTASKAAKPAVRATRAAPARAVPARRAAKTVRARRTVATLRAQSTYQYPQATYSQPAYTWTDGAGQASRPVKRLQIKRGRTAKKAAPTAQSNPATATAGLSGTQFQY
jgi:hypothetical protein